jgi:hypothetical protein
MEETEILKTRTNKFFDFFVLIDYYLQGKRQTMFIWCSFLIVLIAPILDHIILPQRFSLASVSTYFFLTFLFVALIAWAGKFRDEEGKWSGKRVILRTKLSWKIFKELIKGIKGKDDLSRNFTIGLYCFIGGFIIKSLQIASEAIRHPLEKYIKHGHAHYLRTFEGHNHTVPSYIWAVIGYILIISGVIILAYLHSKYPERFNLFEIFVKGKIKPYEIKLNFNSDLTLINSNDKEKISNLAASNPDIIFKNTIKHLGDWQPARMVSEAEYEHDLLEFMDERLREQGISITNQYRVKSANEMGIIDVVVNESLFLELKKKVSNKALENAQGQILKYKRIIEDNNKPLILLFIDNEFGTIRNKYEEFLHDHNKKNSQKIIAIVVDVN